MEIAYPDVSHMGYDHAEADRAARRRAVAALEGVIERSQLLLKQLGDGQESIDSGAGRQILEVAARLPEHLGILEALAGVRESAARNPVVLLKDVAEGRVTRTTALVTMYSDALDQEPKGVQDVVRGQQQ